MNFAMEKPQEKIENFHVLSGLPAELQALIVVGHYSRIPRMGFGNQTSGTNYVIASRGLAIVQSRHDTLMSENFNTLNLDSEGRLIPSRITFNISSAAHSLDDFGNSQKTGALQYGNICWFDGPNNKGTHLVLENCRENKCASMIGKDPVTAQMFTNLWGLNEPSIGALCKHKDAYVFGDSKKPLLCFNYIRAKMPLYFYAKTIMPFLKVSFITPVTLLGLSKDANLYIIDSRKRHSTDIRHLPKVKCYKQTLKDSHGNELKIENFAINSTCPWLVLLCCASKHSCNEYCLSLMNIKEHTLQKLFNSDKAERLWFTNDKFGWLDAQARVHIHSFELLPVMPNSMPFWLMICKVSSKMLQKTVKGLLS